MTSIPERIEKVLSLSKADDCIVMATRTSTSNVRWANNTATTNGDARSEAISIISIKGKKVGRVSSNYFPDDALEDLVRQSERSCDGKPDAPDFMPLIAGDGSVPTGWADGREDLNGESVDFSRPVADLVKAFSKAGSLDVLLFGYASQTAYDLHLGTSSGVRRSHSYGEAGLTIVSKTPDFTVSASHSTDHSQIAEADVDAVYQRLMQRMEWSKKPISLPAGRYSVILEPAAVGELMYYALIQMAARDADEGRTAFSRPGGGSLVGDKLFPDFINMYSDPAEPGLERPDFVATPASGSFQSLFDSGLDCSRTDWIKDGVLNSLITPRFWAAKKSTDPVPFVGNLIVEGDESKPLPGLMANTERALLVTRFWYTRMLDPQTLLLTGLTRDGVYLLEGGEVMGAVNNFRYNMSPVAALRQTTELGASTTAFTITKVPHLRVEDFNMSSVSQAS
ncbi:MAG: metallopeptidase TldD-related protein [Actinomycetota bacterium]|nr:TldD/PmbA family protein [Actinomycetota bacterium]